MRIATPDVLASPAKNDPLYNFKDLPCTGSWPACILAAIASLALIFAAGAQNVSYAWVLGAARSEIHAAVLALASGGATLLGPLCFLAVAKGRGFGTRIAALVLGIGCLTYAATSSLGFVHGARDAGVSERIEATEKHDDARSVAKAAKDELASLKGQSTRVIARRRELTAILNSSTQQSQGKGPSMVGAKDPQAAALAFYLSAAGWKVSADDVGTWLSAGMVLFLETAAALGLMVAASLRPQGGRRQAVTLEAVTLPARLEIAASDTVKASNGVSQEEDHDDDLPPAPMTKRKGGRPVTVLPAQAVERLRQKGGKANGSITSIGKLIGTRSKTATHRLLHRLNEAGAITLLTSAAGVRVALA